MTSDAVCTGSSPISAPRTRGLADGLRLPVMCGMNVSPAAPGAEPSTASRTGLVQSLWPRNTSGIIIDIAHASAPPLYDTGITASRRPGATCSTLGRLNPPPGAAIARQVEVPVESQAMPGRMTPAPRASTKHRYPGRNRSALRKTGLAARDGRYLPRRCHGSTMDGNRLCAGSPPAGQDT